MAAGYLKFKIGETCGVMPAAKVREILPMAELLRPPGRPPELEGFLNLGGELWPVVRLDRALGLTEVVPDVDAHLVVLKHARVAFAVERALEFITSDDAVTAVAPGRFAANHVRHGREVLFVLDVDAALAGLDAAATAEAARRAGIRRAGDAA